MGVTDIATQYSYGVIENIQWKNPDLASGYAQATIRYMDGSTSVETVDIINGNPTAYAGKDGYGEFHDSVVAVSTNTDNNDKLCGTDLYRIEDSADGLVLTHVFTDADKDGVKDTTESNNHITNATIKTGIAAIQGDKNAVIYVNSDTTFLVNNEGTYTVVKGYENIGNYTGTATVDWVNLGNDNYADYVYVTGEPDSAKTSGLFYLTSDNVQAVLDGNEIDYYILQGIVDGVPGNIYVDNAADPNASGTELIDLLVPSFNDKTSTTSYVNRMFAVDYTNGVVTNVCASNLPLSTDKDLSDDVVFVNGNDAYDGLHIAAWYDGTKTDAASYDGQVLTVDGNRYNVVGLEPVVGELVNGDMSDKEIYVIYDPDNTIANAYVAKAVYIADKADTDEPSIVDPDETGTLKVSYKRGEDTVTVSDPAINGTGIGNWQMNNGKLTVVMTVDGVKYTSTQSFDNGTTVSAALTTVKAPVVLADGSVNYKSFQVEVTLTFDGATAGDNTTYILTGETTLALT